MNSVEHVSDADGIHNNIGMSAHTQKSIQNTNKQ